MSDDLTPRERELADAATMLANAVVADGKPAEAVQKQKSAIELEHRRQAKVIAGTIADRMTEMRRREAEISLSHGGLPDVADLTTGPTPEQFDGGDFEKFTPIERGQVRSSTKAASPYRRVAVIVREYRAGTIDDDMMAAARLYRDWWDRSGLEGNWKTMNLAGLGGGDGSSAGPLNDAQVEAASMVRYAQIGVREPMLAVVNAVVIADMSLNQAVREARVRKSKGKALLRLGLLDLHGHIAHLLPVRSGWSSDDDFASCAGTD